MKRKGSKRIVSKTKVASKKSRAQENSYRKKTDHCGTTRKVAKRARKARKKVSSPKLKKRTHYLYDDDPFLLKSKEKKKQS